MLEEGIIGCDKNIIIQVLQEKYRHDVEKLKLQDGFCPCIPPSCYILAVCHSVSQPTKLMFIAFELIGKGFI